MIYSYRCNHCDYVQDARRSMAERHNAPACDVCGGDMRHIITPVEFKAAFLGSVNNPGYMCPVTEQYVSTNRQRRNIIAEHGLIEKG